MPVGIDDSNRPAGEPPRTYEELRQVTFGRPESDREPVPEAGEELLFRRHDWGPCEPATVLSVQDMTEYNDGHGGTDIWDPNVWYGFDHPQSGQLRPDPWPWVTLRLASGREVMVKEARLRASPGWLRPGSRYDDGRRV